MINTKVNEQKYPPEGMGYRKIKEFQKLSLLEKLLRFIGSQVIVQAYVLYCEAESMDLKISFGSDIVGWISYLNISPDIKSSYDDDLSRRKAENIPKSLVGQIINCRITSYSEKTGEFFCERKSIISEATDYCIATYKPGDIIYAKAMHSAHNAGLVCDIGGGFTSLLPFHELTSTTVQSALEIFDRGEFFRCVITEYDEVNRKFSLSLKQLYKIDFDPKNNYCTILELSEGKETVFTVGDIFPVTISNKSAGGGYFVLMKEFPSISILANSKRPYKFGDSTNAKLTKIKNDDGKFLFGVDLIT